MDSERLIDAWLQEGGTSGSTADKNNVSSSTMDASERGGLGYQKTKDHSVSKKDDKVSEMLKKAAKAKQRKGMAGKPSGNKAAVDNDAADESDDDEELHGLVEKTIGKYKAAPVQRPPAQKLSGANSNNMNDVKNTNTKNLSDSTAANKKSSTLAPNAADGSIPLKPVAEMSFLERRKNKVKTRSKQKNIRKDNRPESSKPAYLQIGSTEYRGRSLTKVRYLI